MNNCEQPYTSIELGGTGDLYYLVYCEKKLRLGSTEYAIALSLLNDEGLDITEVEEERLETRSRYSAARGPAEFINPDTLKTCVHRLRMKIEGCFGDELILPRVVHGVSRGAGLKGLRLWTKEQLSALRCEMLNPGSGVFSIRDECMRWHLYVNGHEIKPHYLSALSCHIVKKASSKNGFSPRSEEFQTAYRAITGRDRQMPVNSLSATLVHLRKALEKQVGMTLTRRKAGTKQSESGQPIRLIPYTEQMVNG